MREKTVISTTINRYIYFLNSVKIKSLPFDSKESLSQIVKEHRVAAAVTKSLTDLKIIEPLSVGKWKWIGGEPSKKMVLELLDFQLHQRKKQPTIPIDNTWITAIQQLTDKITVYIDQNQKSLREAKTPFLNRALQQSEMSGNTIFSEQDNQAKQRFELVKSISTAYYSEFSDIRFNDFQYGNSLIIKAADDLLKQYYGN